MSAKKLGMTTVSNPMTAAGILTDGDLRRLMKNIAEPFWRCARADGMTKNPQSFSACACQPKSV